MYLLFCSTIFQLLGGEVYHYHTKLMMKEAKTGGSHLWHQDSFTLIEKKNLSNKCTITGISWNGKICLCQEWLSFRCIVCSCSGGILNRFLVKYQRFLRSMSEQPNLSETRGRHVKYVASDCHMILWNCVLNLWFIMSNVWFYHRSGLNSGPNSPRIMSGQRQNRYRRNQGHRSSGVERLSVNSDNLPPPPK